MTIRNIALIAALALAAVGSSASEKRGVAENQFSMGCQLRALTPGVTWYYNWRSAPGAGYHNEVADFTDMDFIPMCWTTDYNEQAIRDYVAGHPKCKYLLGFNEPNFKNQANLTPAQAAAKWKDVQALAKELNLKLVSPALNFSPNPPYQDPLKWMDEFVALVGLDAFDYTAIHNYGGLGVMKQLATDFHTRYGKPVWVTEFCLWPGGTGDVYVSPQSQMASMLESVQWLEKTDFIFRYAWFQAIGASDANNKPNYALLLPQSGVKESFLTPLGYAYNYLWDFDEDFYAAVGETFPAVNFISSKGLYISKSNNAQCESPIEISDFCYGSTVDWQFDVPTAGEYTLALTVTGMGEPVRFDPSLAVYTVKEDGTEDVCVMGARKFQLPGNFDDYVTLSLPLTLEAGKQTLRLKDAASAQPSDIRISQVVLKSGEGGVNNLVNGEEGRACNVYSVTGTLVRRNADPSAPFAGLAPGLYIMNGNKYIVQ